MTVTSSDGRVQVDLHAAYASALVYVDLTAAGAPSAITILRNEVEVVTQRNTGGTAVWYDHYPSYGTASYTATAAGGGVTTTAAAVTIAAPADGRTWLKSRDPNLSMLVRQAPSRGVRHTKDRGIFRAPLARYPVIIEAAAAASSTELDVWVHSVAERDAIRLLHASGQVYYQPSPFSHDVARWVSLGTLSEDYQYATVQEGMWSFTIPADEVAPPVLDPTNIVIPGWGWDQVVATYGTWDAAVAAKGSWIALLRQGVGA